MRNELQIRMGSSFSRFAKCVAKLSDPISLKVRSQVVSDYLSVTDDKDLLRAVALWMDQKPPRFVTVNQLKNWCLEESRIALWLFDVCKETVGDLVETISLLLVNLEINTDDNSLIINSLHQLIERMESLSSASDQAKKSFVTDCWRAMNPAERLVFNKLVCGRFKSDVPYQVLVNALANEFGVSSARVSVVLSANRVAGPALLRDLFSKAEDADNYCLFPFQKPTLVTNREALWTVRKDWQVEWLWDGVRVQVVVIADQLFVWSHHGELLTGIFPELDCLKHCNNGKTVFDGVLVAIDALAQNSTKVINASALETRLKRSSTPSDKLVKECPVAFIAFDVLVNEGLDVRPFALTERRELLNKTLAPIAAADASVMLSPILDMPDENSLKEIAGLAKSVNALDYVFKQIGSPYLSDNWLCWKFPLRSVLAVLLYAHKGQGGSKSRFSEFSFAVKDAEKGLVVIAQTGLDLDPLERETIENFAARNLVEKFGPVHGIRPILVFEVAFEGIQKSKRHKSGLKLLSPHVRRWHRDLDINGIDELGKLLALLNE